MLDFERLKVQGIKFYYYYICHRKLWLHSKDIKLEHTSDRVLEGKMLHQESYVGKKKERLLDELIKLDLKAIELIQQLPIPPKVENTPVCTKCSFYSFCFAGEFEE